MAPVQNTAQIVVLAHGEIVAQGTHSELVAQDGLYAEMYTREVEQAKENGRNEQAKQREQSNGRNAQNSRRFAKRHTESAAAKQGHASPYSTLNENRRFGPSENAESILAKGYFYARRHEHQTIPEAVA